MSGIRALAVAFTVALPWIGAAAMAQTDAGTYRAGSEVNLRAAPDITAELLGVIPVAAEVTVFNCDAFGWCRVHYGNLDGWAAGQFLIRTGDLPTEAVALRSGAAPEDGRLVEIDGRIGTGAPCARFVGNDGLQYALLGNLPFRPDEPVYVVGTIVATTICGAERTLALSFVRFLR